MIRARLALLALLTLPLAACGGDDSTTTAAVTTTAPPPATTGVATTVESTVAIEAANLRVDVGPNGVDGGPASFEVAKGASVVLEVRSAIADEVHLHGYDLSQDVAQGGTVRIAFKATIAGEFEVELESRGLAIAEITVQ